MPKMKSLVAHTYGGRQLQVDEVFEADPRLVRTLIATGRAEVVETSSYSTTHIGTSPNTKQPRGGRPR